MEDRMGERIQSLVRDLLSGNEDQRETAAQELGAHGDEAAAILDQALGHSDADGRWWVCRALAEVPGSAASATLIRAIDDPDPDVRVCAMLGLCERGAQEAARALLAHLDDPSPYVSAQAGDALCRLGESVVPELIEILKSGPASARVQAARALAAIAAHASIPALIAALDDDSPAVQVYAEEALERMGVGTVFVRPS